MFDIAWSEFLLIGAVALVVIGPKDLPKALRTVGQVVGKVRRMAAEFQGQFNDAMREAELHDLKKQVEDVGGSVTSTPAAQTDFKPIEMPAVPDSAALKEAEAKLAALPPPEPLPPVDLAPELSPPADLPAPVEKPKRARKPKDEAPVATAGPATAPAEAVAEAPVADDAPKTRRRAKAAAPAEPEVDTVAEAAPAKPARARKSKASAGNEGSPA
ncbi:MAG: twin-arginine translocase subunit TatB [Chelatococcus sp.]|nr:MAG: twin-arginine translocase subunit TatB [Chelatococcus sp.]